MGLFSLKKDLFFQILDCMWSPGINEDIIYNWSCLGVHVMQPGQLPRRTNWTQTGSQLGLLFLALMHDTTLYCFSSWQPWLSESLFPLLSILNLQLVTFSFLSLSLSWFPVSIHWELEYSLKHLNTLENLINPYGLSREQKIKSWKSWYFLSQFQF